jgi:hypothetical protein
MSSLNTVFEIARMSGFFTSKLLAHIPGLEVTKI